MERNFLLLTTYKALPMPLELPDLPKDRMVFFSHKALYKLTRRQLIDIIEPMEYIRENCHERRGELLEWPRSKERRRRLKQVRRMYKKWSRYIDRVDYHIFVVKKNQF